MTRRIVVALLIVAALAPAAAAAGEIPARPEQIVYPPFRFAAPLAERFQHRLRNGVPVYIAEDHALPLVNVSITFRIGAFLEPPDRVGLASLTGVLLRKGGAGSRSANEFDERADFLALNLASGIGATSGVVTLNTLKDNLDAGLDLLFDMLTSPRFEQGRLEIEKGALLEALKQRNDNADDILDREWSWLLRGAEHFSARRMTKADLDRITREDLVSHHQRFVRPERIAAIAVAGDVNAPGLLADLERRFASWRPKGQAAQAPWPPPAPAFQPRPGLHYVEKDIPQGKVAIGHLGATWKAPDHFAAQVMNHILGGGGFTSRITKKIRSDEGLAYTARTAFELGTWWPGEFRIYFQTKSATVALASQLALKEVRRIREQPVSAEELDVAKNALIESFPRRFDSPINTVNLFVEDDLLGRPHSYWRQYQDNIRRVTVADVQRAAQKWLRPDQLVLLMVGRWAEIGPGDPDRRASMKEFYGGQAARLPLRDPLTLEPKP